MRSTVILFIPDWLMLRFFSMSPKYKVPKFVAGVYFSRRIPHLPYHVVSCLSQCPSARKYVRHNLIKFTEIVPHSSFPGPSLEAGKHPMVAFFFFLVLRHGKSQLMHHHLLTTDTVMCKNKSPLVDCPL